VLSKVFNVAPAIHDVHAPGLAAAHVAQSLV